MTGHNPQQSPQSGFSQEWEQRYREGTHLSIWPWSDVVAYVQRYAKPAEAFTKVLELGCGAGANIPFFVSRGDDYHAVEGSRVIVAELHTRFPSLANVIVAADFTMQIPFDMQFDLVLDRGSITCNDSAAIARCLGLVADRLRAGGMFIGIDWFTNAHSDARNGIEVDAHTRRGRTPSDLHGVGNLHFADRAQLETLLDQAGLVLQRLERKTATVLSDNDTSVRDAFNFVALKP